MIGVAARVVQAFAAVPKSMCAAITGR